MLFEDLSVAVQSLHWRQSENRARTKIKGPIGNEAEKLSGFISRERHYGDFDDQFSIFLSSVAGALARYGLAPYEVVSEIDPETNTRCVRCLEFLSPDSLQYSLTGFYQYDSETRFPREQSVEGPVLIPYWKTMVFHLPYFRPSGWRSLVWSLAKLGGSTVPEFALSEIGRGTQSSFEFERYKATKDIGIAKITKDFGWDARGLFHDQISEWYMLKRRLRYERFRVAIRNQIVQKLNECFGRTLPGFSSETEVIVENGLSLDLISKREQDLLQGGCDFNDILKEFAKS
jgi:hypothetical protein